MYTGIKPHNLTWANILAASEDLNIVYKVFIQAAKEHDPEKLKNFIRTNLYIFRMLYAGDAHSSGIYEAPIYDIQGKAQKLLKTENIMIISNRHPIKEWVLFNFPLNIVSAWNRVVLDLETPLSEILEGDGDTNESFRILAKEFAIVIHETSKLLQRVYPEHTTYLGYNVINQEHLSDYVAHSLLESVDVLVALFKKRHVSPLLKKGLNTILIRYGTQKDKGIAYYSYAKTPVIELLQTALADSLRTQQRNKDIVEIIIHELGHYIHISYMSPDAKRFWDAPWEDTDAEKLKELGIPTEYGRANKYEDFAETFYWFMIKPEQLSPQARYRIQRTLSLSGLYGQPVMQLAHKLTLAGHADLALELLKVVQS